MDIRLSYQWVPILVFVILLITPLIAGFFVGWKKSLYWGGGFLAFYALGWILTPVCKIPLAYSIVKTFHIEVPGVSGDDVANILANYSGLIMMIISLLIGWVFLSVFYWMFAKKKILKIGLKKNATNSEKVVEEVKQEVTKPSLKKKILRGLMGSVISFTTTLPIVNSFNETAFSVFTNYDARNDAGFKSDLFHYIDSFNNVFGYNYTNLISETTDSIYSVVDLFQIKDSNGDVFLSRTFNNLSDLVQDKLIYHSDDKNTVDFVLKTKSQYDKVISSLTDYAKELHKFDNKTFKSLENAFAALDHSPRLVDVVSTTIANQAKALPSDLGDKLLDITATVDNLILGNQVGVYDNVSQSKTHNIIYLDLKTIMGNIASKITIGNLMFKNLVEKLTPKVFSKQPSYETNKEAYKNLTAKLLSLYFTPKNQSEFNQITDEHTSFSIADGSVTGIFNKDYVFNSAKDSGLDWVTEQQYKTYKDTVQKGTIENPYLIPLNLFYKKTANNTTDYAHVFPSAETNEYQPLININALFNSYPNIYPFEGGSFYSKTEVISEYQKDKATEFVNFTDGQDLKNASFVFKANTTVPSADDIGIYTVDNDQMLKIKVSLTYKPHNPEYPSKTQDFYFNFFWINK